MANTSVNNGHTVSNVVVSNGSQTVSSGGTAVDTLVVASGAQIVLAGGHATVTTISVVTGLQVVQGSAIGTLLLLGSQGVVGGGVATGDVLDGGQATAANGGRIISATLNGGI